MDDILKKSEDLIGKLEKRVDNFDFNMTKPKEELKQQEQPDANIKVIEEVNKQSKDFALKEI